MIIYTLILPRHTLLPLVSHQRADGQWIRQWHADSRTGEIIARFTRWELEWALGAIRLWRSGNDKPFYGQSYF